MNYKVIRRGTIRTREFEQNLNDLASQGWRVTATLSGGMHDDQEIILAKDPSTLTSTEVLEIVREAVENHKFER